MDSKCYICQEESTKLISICVCKARIHQKCFNQQIKNEVNECGLCRRKLIYTQRKKCNFGKCLWQNGLSLFYWLFQSGGVPLLFFGKSLFTPGSEWGWVLAFAIIMAVGMIGMWIFPTCCYFWTCCLNFDKNTDDEATGKQCCFCNQYVCGPSDLDHDPTEKDYSAAYKLMLLTMALEVPLVMTMHTLGLGVNKLLWHRSDFLTWRSSVAGVMTCLIFFLTGCLFWGVWILIRCLKKYVIKQYGETEYVPGTT